MSAVAVRQVTPEEFFALAERSEQKLEYVAGRIVAQAKGSIGHGDLVTTIGAGLFNATSGGRCRSYTDSASVYIPLTDAYRTPDALVACPPNVVDRRRGIIDNPTVVVEVLSPGTKETDLSDKMREYASIPSLAHYVLVDSERMMVQTISRTPAGDWRIGFLSSPEDVLRLPEIGFEIPLAELYEGVVFDAPEG